ncbi:aldehyde ferredoxin oxidoreductase family protein [Infirmifilum uzonense]|uniref:aldehyde ferredoxin oxidoreductase family protein n=1 Tax=Infirmifilum uzonense TaxID=1550241 RepID=UPI003C72B720
MIYGYHGRLLDIDLSHERIGEHPLEEEVLRDYIGGRGLAAYILLRELGHRWENVDPLGEENILLFLTGPLTGYYPGVKLAVSGKSPQSNGIVGSVLSSEVAIELKAAGYDGVLVRGKARDPVYVYIEGERVEIRDASHLWGLNGRETFSRLMKEVWNNLKSRNLARQGLTKEPSFVYIGPAGENKVRTAAVMAKLAHAAGYGGYGAVMGSKNLKALVAKGFGPMPKPKHPEWVKLLIKESWNRLNRRTTFKQWGTGSGGYQTAALTSSEPVRNWQEEWHDNRAMGQQYFEAHWVKRFWADYGCPSACMKISYLRSGARKGALTDTPDYELQAYMGPNLGVFEPRSCIYLSSIADDLGLCGIQTGNLLGYVAELYEKGLLSEKDLSGVKPKWGDAEAFARLMLMIAKREGIGNLMAEGGFRFALELQKLKGVDVRKYLVHSKGIAIGAHGVRSGKDYLPEFSYATSTQGGDHTSAPRKPYEAPWGELWMTFPDSAVICAFNAETDLMFQFLEAITGFGITREEWMNAHAKRILSLQRVALLLGGPDIYWRPLEDDDLPPRFYEPLPSGPFKGKAVEKEKIEKERAEYFSFMGWDSLGIPKEETLQSLNIEFVRPFLARVKGRVNNTREN